jgi:predicted RNase H-like nuclease (RuvC/YqgF family)
MPQDDVLKKIDEQLGAIRQQLYEQGADVGRLVAGQKGLEKGQQELDTTVGQLKTAIEVVKAGQDDIRTDMGSLATKDDIHWLATKLDQHRKRIENLEEKTDTPNPFKH